MEYGIYISNLVLCASPDRHAWDGGLVCSTATFGYTPVVIGSIAS